MQAYFPRNSSLLLCSWHDMQWCIILRFKIKVLETAAPLIILSFIAKLI